MQVFDVLVVHMASGFYPFLEAVEIKEKGELKRCVPLQTAHPHSIRRNYEMDGIDTPV